jgi:hypothetical protein
MFPKFVVWDLFHSEWLVWREENLVRKTQKLYKVLIFAQLLIKQKLKEKIKKGTSF